MARTFTVDFSEEAYQALHEMSKELGVPKNEVLRKALATLRFLLRKKKEGCEIILERDSAREKITHFRI